MRPDLVVIHFTAMTDTGSALDRLCDPVAEVSAHYLIDPDGIVHAMVPEDVRAWHAGAGAWGGVVDVNSRSVGIELCNDGRSPFAAAQMDALEEMLRGIMSRWSIPRERIIGHSDCAPGRKADPGRRFDWARLAMRGLAAPTPSSLQTGRFVDDMRRAGYTATDDPAILLAALRLRHRPWACGPRDARDEAIAHGLARDFPVDRKGASG
ncbi:N-acetylmuramoyl-L-alanine amidase [Palleronia sp. LCG004]|uniref:N-acetylmuramoyl-L-alanine amidase n=1 Tax=Palleronia sp. LCG004 TaxID=3079304 RepID=UPI002941D9EE|nr:N-acetylmuramoyl-L-alanine amidase [Palleronia sp. LCG004]WOI56879.1 N-acetylmuramoyl-L-alanine amidase [Palleronia sp. LCG004]